MVVRGVCVKVSPNRGDVEETVVSLTGNGILNSEGDPVEESDVRGEESGLLSLNNNPLLLLRTNFALSLSGSGRRSAGSFTAMVLMSVGIVEMSSMGTPNSRWDTT